MSPDGCTHFIVCWFPRWWSVNVKKCMTSFVNPHNVARKIPEATLNRSLVVLARMPDMMPVLIGHIYTPCKGASQPGRYCPYISLALTMGVFFTLQAVGMVSFWTSPGHFGSHNPSELRRYFFLRKSRSSMPSYLRHR